MDSGLAGKVAIVTGAASGIGLECALALGREGAHVVCADLDEAAAGRAAERLGGRSIGVTVDVTSPEGAPGWSRRRRAASERSTCS